MLEYPLLGLLLARFATEANVNMKGYFCKECMSTIWSSVALIINNKPFAGP